VSTPVREKRCECCDLPISSCGKAAEARQRADARAQRRYLIRLGWFESLYPGVCDRCDVPFRPGTLIKANGLKTYLAECCAPERP
jgi:hypothetical protein